jgi:hypothetical protein
MAASGGGILLGISFEITLEIFVSRFFWTE